MSLVDNDNLPAPGTLAALIDLGARLRVFDYDGSLTTASKQVWDLIEPDIRTISDAYWQQWLRCFADDRLSAPHETEKMGDLGIVFLQSRFLDTYGRTWVDSVERSVAADDAAQVSPAGLLSRINASERAQ